MSPRAWYGVAASTLAFLGGCAPEAEPLAVAPVVQNISYNTTTNVYPQPPVYAAHAAPPPPPPLLAYVPVTPPPPEPLPLPPADPPLAPLAAPPGMELAPSGPLRPDLPSTGVPVCDAYLARLEICTTRILSGPPQAGPHVWTSQAPSALPRMRAAFDLMRRNWRRAAETRAGRESLEDSCETSLAMYNDSLRGQCR